MKWFNNNNKNLADTRLVIFDFDETLYFTPNQNTYYVNYVKQCFVDLANLTEQQADEQIKRYKFDTVGEDRVSFREICGDFGITPEMWDEYKVEHYFTVDYENATVADGKLLHKLASLCPIVVASNELLPNLRTKAKAMNVDLSAFANLYAVETTKRNHVSKQELYEQICRSYNVPASNVVAVGDRYMVDIKPLVEIGGYGVQVDNTNEVDEVVRLLIDAITNR